MNKENSNHPYFVRCSLESFRYLRDETVNNNPVNLSLCTSIRKCTFAWYPDNKGKPSIKFDGCNKEWAYQTEADRDADFERIAGNQLA